jgi:5-methylcytosine-specific restriction protein A
MRVKILEESHFIAHFLAKFPDSYEILGIGNHTKTHKFLSPILNITESSFKRLRDEYDGFYTNRKGYPDVENRKSRVEYKLRFESISKEIYLKQVQYLIKFMLNKENILELTNDEIYGLEKFEEGGVITVTVNKYERNLKAKKKCLEHYGRVCKVCGFRDFEKYGDEIGIIEVHHIKPISEMGVLYMIDPLKDLMPVCPNCHRAIHSRKPALELSELKIEMLIM